MQVIKLSGKIAKEDIHLILVIGYALEIDRGPDIHSLGSDPLLNRGRDPLIQLQGNCLYIAILIHLCGPPAVA